MAPLSVPGVPMYAMLFSTQHAWSVGSVGSGLQSLTMSIVEQSTFDVPASAETVAFPTANPTTKVRIGLFRLFTKLDAMFSGVS